MNCYLTVNIMMLYISAIEHARKLNFCSYVYLPAINKKKIQYCYAWVILCSVGYYLGALYLRFENC